MEVNLKQFLSENPCYLLAIIILAIEGDRTLLMKSYDDERSAFEALRIARDYESLMKTYTSEDFPISISDSNQIWKIPERLAGFLLCGKQSFYKIPSGNFEPKESFGESWLKKFSAVEQKKIKSKYQELTKKDLPHVDSSKSGDS